MTTYPNASAARRRLAQRIAPVWRELACDHADFDCFVDEVLDNAGELAAEHLGGGNYVWSRTGPVVTQGPGKVIGPERVLVQIGGYLEKALDVIASTIAFEMPCGQCGQGVWDERLDYMCAQ